MRHERSHTKVIATIGPATRNKEILEKMFHEGVDVCRINCSHDTHEEHAKTIKYINELNEELGTNVAIMADLQGPKLRVGEMENGSVMLEDGQKFAFVTTPCIGTKEQAYLSYDRLPKDAIPGEMILVDDGKLMFEVIESNGKDRVITKVIAGGPLSNKKGVNLPDTKVSAPSLTEKDIIDAQFALDQKADWLALSFVRKAKDIADLRKIVNAHPNNAGIIAKIEKPEAVREINEIIDAADAIMVARGDLGVEVEFNKVPVIQKSIIKKCHEMSKPVIVATQMMESMISNPTPTRAEANDVANAVLDGADAVMLSGETSVGKVPCTDHHQHAEDYRLYRDRRIYLLPQTQTQDEGGHLPGRIDLLQCHPTGRTCGCGCHRCPDPFRFYCSKYQLSSTQGSYFRIHHERGPSM